MADNGGEFLGVVSNWLKENGINRKKTHAYDPHTNGSAERTVGTFFIIPHYYSILLSINCSLAKDKIGKYFDQNPNTKFEEGLARVGK